MSGWWRNSYGLITNGRFEIERVRRPTDCQAALYDTLGGAAYVGDYKNIPEAKEAARAHAAGSPNRNVVTGEGE